LVSFYKQIKALNSISFTKSDLQRLRFPNSVKQERFSFDFHTWKTAHLLVEGGISWYYKTLGSDPFTRFFHNM